jgi:multiple sugar transport system ATP-binding protein
MLLVASGLVLASLAVAGEEPAVGVPAVKGEPPRNPQSVRVERRQMAASLVSQLGNPKYEIREAATKNLEQLGIDAIEPLGAETYLHAKAGTQTLIARIAADTWLATGQNVVLALDLSKAQLFDPATERRL